MISRELTSGRTVHRNGDYSGEVRIRASQSEVTAEEGYRGGEDYFYVELPFADLLEIVAGYLTARKIGELEQMSTEEVFATLQL
jgi:hypothetical protein